jgi:hypothetical protein
MPSRNKIRYQPVEECIYCGSKTAELTDEHLIPYGFTGLTELILPDASCVACSRKINSEIETPIQHRILGNTRIRLNLPTRNPQKRPTTTPVWLLFDDRSERRDILISDLPLHATMLRYGSLPKILTGEPTMPASFQVVSLMFDKTGEERQMLRDRYGTDKFRFTSKFNPALLARFLAKIAHGYCVASLGIDGFIPFLKPYILNLDLEIIRFVGCLPPEPPRANNDLLHTISLSQAMTDRFGYTAVRIRFFASWESPTYLVIAGQPKLLS